MEATGSFEKSVAIDALQTGENEQVQNWGAEKQAGVKGQN